MVPIMRLSQAISHAVTLKGGVAMNEIERLRELLTERFPQASIQLDQAELPGGSWWLDVTLKDHSVVIEWREGRGFGLSTPSEGDYGSGPDEVYPGVSETFERTKEILLSRARTSPPREVPLPRLREARQLSQVELARRLNINQGALSRMERRSDMLLTTLRNAITAMGGQLELRAIFPDGTFRISLDEIGTAENSAD